MNQLLIHQQFITELLVLSEWAFTYWFFLIWNQNMNQLTQMKGSPHAVLSWALPFCRENRFIWAYCHG